VIAFIPLFINLSYCLDYFFFSYISYIFISAIASYVSNLAECFLVSYYFCLLYVILSCDYYRLNRLNEGLAWAQSGGCVCGGGGH